MEYLPGYTKYKVLTLTGGADGAQTNFQLEIAVSYEAAMQGDFDDIRFTEADGITLVDAWAELIVTDTSATVWVEFPTTPANTVEQTYYMYYGNAGAASDWDIRETFLFGDDFSQSVLTCHFANNGLFVPFTRISPAGIYNDNNTYIAWQGKPNNLDPYVIKYDHSTEQWSSAVKVGDNQLGDDDHGSPCIIRDSTGYLHVFYGAHNSSIQHAKSTNTDDITAWTQKTSIGALNAYNMLVAAGSDLYLFYRHTATGRPIAYRKSSDAGESWSAEHLIVQFASSDWCYCGGIDLESTTKVHMSWCYYDTLDTTRKNVYHAYLKLSDGHMYSIGGTDLGTQITKTEANTYCLVHDSSGNAIYNPRVHTDSSGVPYILYTDSVGGYNIKFVRWNGSAWTTPETISTGIVAEFLVHSPTNIEAYIIDLSYNVDKWTWNGTTWSFIEQIYTKGSMVATSSPKIILNGNSDLKIVFGEQNEDYTTSLKTYAYGDNGFVQYESGDQYLDTDIWDVITGSPTVENDQLHLDDGERIDTKTWTGNTVALRLKATVPNETGSLVWSIFGLSENTLNPFSEFITYYDWDVRSRNDSGSETTTISAYNGEHTFEILKNAGTEAKYYVDDVLKDTDTTYVLDAAMPIRLGKTGANDLIIDWVLTRKYVANPPTYAFGSEESVPGHPTMRRWAGIPGMQYTGRRSW